MMLSKHIVAMFFRSVLSCHLKGQKGWRQSLFETETYLLRSCAHYCFTASDESGSVSVGHTPSPNYSPLYRCGTAGESSHLQSAERSRSPSTAVEKPCRVGGMIALCLLSAKNYIQNDSRGRGIASAVPDSESEGRSAAHVVLSPAPSLKTAEVDIDESCEESTPSLKSSGGRHPRKKVRPCDHDGCKVRFSAYGFPDEEPTRCRRHMLEGMVIRIGGCKEEGCNRAASFNFPGHAGVLWCKAHKSDGMVLKTRPLCRVYGCTSGAAFGGVKDTRPSFCKHHAASDMIFIYASHRGRCQWERGCMERADHGHASDKVKRLCRKHREPGMVNLHHCCEKPSCTKLAQFGWRTRGVRMRCSEHKEDGMVRMLLCIFEGCDKVPSFGFEGDKTPSRCGVHREEGMVYLRKKVCAAEGCTKWASFGFEGESATRCGKHREEGMRHLRMKVCAAEGCASSASFGYEGDKGASRCVAHREDGMRYMWKNVCAVQGCVISASFGFEGDKRVSRCGAHKEEGMQNLARARRRGVLHATMIAEADVLEAQKRHEEAGKF